MVGSTHIRQRIAAKNRRLARIDDQPQNHKLTRLEDWKKLPIDWLKNDGSDALALFINARDSRLSKSGQCRCLFLIGESRIPCHRFGARILLDHCLERTLPTPAKCRNPQRALQLLAGMSGQIQKGVNVGHTHPLWIVNNCCNVISLTNFSLLQRAKVESRPVVRYEQAGIQGSFMRIPTR